MCIYEAFNRTGPYKKGPRKNQTGDKKIDKGQIRGRHADRGGDDPGDRRVDLQAEALKNLMKSVERDILWSHDVISGKINGGCGIIDQIEIEPQ